MNVSNSFQSTSAIKRFACPLNTEGPQPIVAPRPLLTQNGADAHSTRTPNLDPGDTVSISRAAQESVPKESAPVAERERSLGRRLLAATAGALIGGAVGLVTGALQGSELPSLELSSKTPASKAVGVVMATAALVPVAFGIAAGPQVLPDVLLMIPLLPICAGVAMIPVLMAVNGVAQAGIEGSRRAKAGWG